VPDAQRIGAPTAFSMLRVEKDHADALRSR